MRLGGTGPKPPSGGSGKPQRKEVEMVLGIEEAREEITYRGTVNQSGLKVYRVQPGSRKIAVKAKNRMAILTPAEVHDLYYILGDLIDEWEADDN
jgi:hypothetical protein